MLASLSLAGGHLAAQLAFPGILTRQIAQVRELCPAPLAGMTGADGMLHQLSCQFAEPPRCIVHYEFSIEGDRQMLTNWRLFALELKLVG